MSDANISQFNWRLVNQQANKRLNVISLKRHVTFRDFTLLVIFYPLSQQHNRRCQSHVVYVYQLHYFFMWCHISNRISKKPSIHQKIELIELRSRSCLVHLQLIAEPNVIYLALPGQRRHQLIPLNYWVYSIQKHLREVNVSQACVSSEKKPIPAPIGLFGDYEGRDFTICLKYRPQTWCEIQTFGFVNASILIKIGDVKLWEK